MLIKSIQKLQSVNLQLQPPPPLSVHCIVHETKPNGSKSLETKAEQVFSVLWKESQLRPSQRTQQRPLSANNRDGVIIFSQ